MKETTWEAIKKLIAQAVQEQKEKKTFHAGKDVLALQYPSFDEKEIIEGLDSMLTGYVSMGKKVKEFEQKWAAYVGKKFCTMVNSGSSANLLALDALRQPKLARHIEPGDEVVIPAVTWSTTLFPIIQIGARPVLVDIELETLNIDPKKIEAALSKKTKVLMPVHLLGNPCDMPKIMDIAQRHHLWVIEDTCESHGAEVGGKKAGNFGDLSTFSFMFAHHMTTAEGGCILYDDPTLDDVMRPLRAHGWIRELRPEKRNQYIKERPDLDSRFLFCMIGYNVRMNDIQGGFGLHQTDKLEAFIRIRRRNHRQFVEGMAKYKEVVLVQEERPGTRHTSYALSMVIRPEASFTRKAFMDFLEQHHIETRPITAGLLTEQPMWQAIKDQCRVSGNLEQSRIVHERGFFVGNNQELTEEKMSYLMSVIGNFMQKQ